VVVVTALAMMAASLPGVGAAPAEAAEKLENATKVALLESEKPERAMPAKEAPGFSMSPSQRGAQRSEDQLPEIVQELESRRDAKTRVFRNEDGSLTVDAYAAPIHYKTKDGWEPISNKVEKDSERSDWLKTSKNAWKVAFGPSSKGLELHTAGGKLSMRPVAAVDEHGKRSEPNDVAPSAREVKEDDRPKKASDAIKKSAVPSAQVVDYRDLWEQVNLRYTVRSDGVKEDIVVAGSGAASEFRFELRGADLALTDDGGLRFRGDLGDHFRVPAPTVSAADGADLTDVSEVRFEVDELERGTGGIVTVSVDKDWLAQQPKSVFPLVIDPSFWSDAPTSAITYASTGGTVSGNPVQIGTASGVTKRAAVRFNQYEQYIGQGYRVYHSHLNFYRQGTTSGSTTIELFDQGAQPSGYSAVGTGRPLLGSITDPAPDGYTTIQTYETMDRWLTEGTTGQWFGIRGTETNSQIRTYDVRLYMRVYQPPKPTFVNNVSDGQVLTIATPTLVAQPVPADEDGPYGLPSYEFQITTAPAPGSGLVVSGSYAHPDNTPSWQVPPGALKDGVTYYAWVVTDNSLNLGHVPPVLPPLSMGRRFKLDLGLGGGGPSPTDEVGAVPGQAASPAEGAPSPSLPASKLTVNLVDGNASLSLGTKSLATVSGQVALGFTYNSLAVDDKGLRGEFFNDTNSNGEIDSGDVKVGERIDPTVNFDWGFAAPAVAAQDPTKALARWTGFLTLPSSGSWQLGAVSSDGLRVTYDGTTRLDRWAAHEPEAAPVFGSTFSATAGQAVPITVEWRNTGGASVARVSLKALSEPDSPIYGLSPGWVIRTAETMPDGWTFSAAAGAARWVGLEDRGTGVTVFAADGSGHQFTAVDGAYEAPITAPGDRLTLGGDGRFTLESAGGLTYTFRTDGALEAIVSPADDRQPAALTYTYSGSPVRLRTITDPVSNRSVTLSYGGDAPCSGAPAAAGGLLCHIAFWDGTATTLTYDSAGRFVRITNPGAIVHDLAYDSNGRLTDIRDPLANDAIAAGVRADDTSARTQIAYDSEGRVSKVTQPAPSAGAQRPERTYTYDPANRTAEVDVAGFSPTSGFAQRVRYDTRSRITESWDAAGLRTTYTWDTSDRLVARRDSAGLVTTTEYDHASRPIATYGPAPATSFGSDAKPLPTGPLPNDPGGTYNPVTPIRVVNTSTPSGTCKTAPAPGATTSCGPWTHGLTKRFKVTGVGGVPATGVAAVVVDFAVFGSTAAGFIKVNKSSGQAAAGGVTFDTNESMHGLVLAAVDDEGYVSVFADMGSSGDTVQLLADVAGWYASPDATTTGTVFVPSEPATRLVDTRNGTGVCPTSPCAVIPGNLSNVSVQASGRSGIPAMTSGLTAVALNVSVESAGGSGLLKVGKDPASFAAAGLIYFAANDTANSTVIVPVDANGQFKIQSSGVAHTYIDVAGWFTSSTGAVGATVFHPNAPERVLDTRSSSRKGECPTFTSECTTFTNGSTKAVQISGRAGVPAWGIGAVVLNVTATGPPAAGYIKINRVAGGQAADGTIHFEAGEGVTSSIIATLNGSGQISIYADKATDVIIDVAGYFEYTTGLPVPVQRSEYDGGINGLAASWYSNRTLSGAAKAHTLSSGTENWGAGSPATGIPADNFSGNLSGYVVPGQVGGRLSLTAERARLYVDDRLEADNWSGPYRDAVVSDQPVGYWRLGESAGATAAGDSAGSNPGSYAAGTTAGQSGALTGDPDTAALFNGTSAGVSVPDATSLDFERNQAFTMEAWVKTTQSTGILVSKVEMSGSCACKGYEMFVNSGVLRAHVSALYASSTNSIIIDGTKQINDGRWHHVAVTSVGSSTASGITLFVDGVSDAKRVVRDNLSSSILNNATLTIGSRQATYPLNGTIDEAAVYPTALPSSQIAAHYAASEYTTSISSLNTIDGAYRSSVLNDEPAGFWRLGETSERRGASDQQDRNPGEYTAGVGLNQPGVLAGDADASVSFNGASTGVRVPDVGYLDFEKNQPLTLEAWIKTTATGAVVLVSKINNDPGCNCNGYEMYLDAGVLRLILAGNGGFLNWVVVRGTTLVNDNQWHHVAATSTGSGTAAGTTLYVDGVPETKVVDVDALTTPILNDAPVTIGSRQGNYPFTGSIDEAAIYPVSLSPDRIAAHFAAKSQAATPGATAHRIRVDYQHGTGNASLALTGPAGTSFQPGYNLKTKVTDADGKVTATEYADAGAGIGPQFGIATATIADPAGLNLRTTTTYESPGTGSFLRRTARTLPAGNQWVYTNYSGTEGPVGAVCGVTAGTPQGGQVKRVTAPDPDGGGAEVPRVEEFVYDAVGRPVGRRIGSTATIGAAGWQCGAYDARGRLATDAWSAHGTAAARSVTYSYAVGGNPLVSKVTDNTWGSSAISATVDLLGRTLSYTDIWGDSTTTTYDRAGRVTNTVGPAGAMAQSYDAGTGRVATLTRDGSTLSTPTYDPFGRLASVAYGNGSSVQRGYDIYGRQSSSTHVATNGQSGETVNRSLAGRVIDQQVFDGTSLVDAVPTGPNYLYDGAGRLTQVNLPGVGFSYGYGTTTGCPTNGAGANTNRTALTVTGAGAATKSYCYDNADRLVSDTDHAAGTVLYDDHGNTIGLGSELLEFDSANRHVRVERPTQVTRYRRDPLDRIAERTDATRISHVATTTASTAAGTTVTVDRPAGTQAGDLVVAALTIGVAGTLTSPGWTVATSQSQGTQRTYLLWRYAAAGDPLSWVFTNSAPSSLTASLSSYRNVAATNAVEVSATATTTASTSHPLPQVTTTSDARHLIHVIGFTGNVTSTAPSGTTQRASTAAGSSLLVADRYQSSAGLSSALVANSSVPVPSASLTIALVPLRTITRLGYSGHGDKSAFVRDDAGAVIERTIALPGGTTYGNGSTGVIWSNANIHGDVVTTTSSSGARNWSGFSGPYGESPSLSFPGNTASPGTWYGWHGGDRRFMDRTIMPMGARAYAPSLGRFLQVDAIEGGSANDYDYAAGDPCNSHDLSGHCRMWKKNGKWHYEDDDIGMSFIRAFSLKPDFSFGGLFGSGAANKASKSLDAFDAGWSWKRGVGRYWKKGIGGASLGVLATVADVAVSKDRCEPPSTRMVEARFERG
jgi:RHS repeat-associated protein